MRGQVAWHAWLEEKEVTLASAELTIARIFCVRGTSHDQILCVDSPRADAPGIEDTSFTKRDCAVEGVLVPCAASALMEVLCLTRCCRFDLACTV
eukprot:6056753-Pyramimonas_sp.AAC.1